MHHCLLVQPCLPRSPVSARRGGARVLVIVLFVALLGVLIAGGAAVYHGSGKQVRLEEKLAQGYDLVQQNKPGEAANAFSGALSELGGTLSAYQMVRKTLASATFLTPQEIGQLVVSACLMEAYNDFFALKPSPGWIEKASGTESLLDSPDAQEVKLALATARRVSDLCELFQKKDYQRVMKDLLAAEKQAAETDMDFFIQEIRLLIACGKALDEPAIINHARELLFFYTYEIKLKNPRMDQLWRIISR